MYHILMLTIVATLILTMTTNNNGSNDNTTISTYTCTYNAYGQFSQFHVCFCGLDPGNLKFETVRTNKQHICFQDLRRSI